MMISKTAQKIAQTKDYLQALGHITTRSQFGGYGLLADGVMFAVIAEGELYLRATGDLELECQARGMANMIYSKRGIPVTMRYYLVDELLWQQKRELYALAWRAVQDARRSGIKDKGDGVVRLKDLPNIDINLERLLWKVGICNAYQLRLQGAKEAYLLLIQQQSQLGLTVLFSLAGAIAGYHHAVLPSIIRDELIGWFNRLIKKAE